MRFQQILQSCRCPGRDKRRNDSHWTVLEFSDARKRFLPKISFDLNSERKLFTVEIDLIHGGGGAKKSFQKAAPSGGRFTIFFTAKFLTLVTQVTLFSQFHRVLPFFILVSHIEHELDNFGWGGRIP